MFKALISLFSLRQKVDPSEAVRKARTNRAIVIDVREPAEIAASGKASGAINIPLGQFATCANPNSAQFHPALADAKRAGLPVYIFCASGIRSGRAAKIMRSFGFHEVYNLRTLENWTCGGGEIEH